MMYRSVRRVIGALLAAAVLAAVMPTTLFAAESSDAREILNGAVLNPVSPGSQALDELLDEIMEDIFDGAGDDLDTYEQVSACYDYLVSTVRYGSHTANLGAQVGGSVTCRDIYSQYGAVEGFGAVALTARVGMCNAYASAFIVMARKIGLNAYLVKGSTRSAGGRLLLSRVGRDRN